MSVYQYIQNFIQQFKGSHRVKLSAAMLLSSVVLGAVGVGLISQNTSAMPFLSTPGSAHTQTSVRSVPRSKITLAPDTKVVPTPVPTVAPTPVPATEAVPTPAPMPATPAPVAGGDVVSIIQQVFGPYSNAAISVAQCESGLNPSAVGPGGAVGLFQILPSTFNTTAEAGNSPYDAYANASAAYDIFVRDGYSWREWTCQP